VHGVVDAAFAKCLWPLVVVIFQALQPGSTKINFASTETTTTTFSRPVLGCNAACYRERDSSVEINYYFF